MRFRKKAPSQPIRVASGKLWIEELDCLRSELDGLNPYVDTLKRMTRVYEYRVTQQDDVWRAATIEWESGSWMYSPVPVERVVAFGATKKSAVANLKREVLRGTKAKFCEVPA